MAEIQDKILRLRVALLRLEEFKGAGGKDHSSAAVPIIEELMQAFADLAKELGHEILTSLKP
jgi:hypothetical protein